MQAPRSPISPLQQRPPRWLRGAVLVLAVAALGLTMCHSARRDASAPANQAAPQSQAMPQNQAGQQRPAAPPQANAPTTNPPAEKPAEKIDHYFPATKAAGPIR